jgi:dihydrofolate reductase
MEKYFHVLGIIWPRWPNYAENSHIRRIKSHDGPDLVLWGSSTLTSTLLEHGLADEVLLVVYPVLLGTEKRLFAEGTSACMFELASTMTTPTGILINSYKVVGPLKTG